jgi:aminoglycoside N3'-acetyltransferase
MIGEAFAETVREQKGKIGQAETLLVLQRELVDFAVKWMETNRNQVRSS